MKYLLVAFSVLWICASGAWAAGGGDGVAVIIGNRSYQSRDIPAVAFAHRDAEAFKRYVLDVLGYRPDNIIDLRDATKGQMEAVFGNRDSHRGKAFQYVTPDRSDLVVYYSGHGVPGLNDKRGYLLPVDSDPSTAEINGYPTDLLFDNLGKVGARSVTVYLDACFSGNSADGMLIKSASPVFIRSKLPTVAQGVAVVTAASGDQLASWDREARFGLFTNHLLDALYGQADRQGDRNGTITLAEVKAYLDDTMTRAARRNYNRDQTANTIGAAAVVLGPVPGKSVPQRPPVADTPVRPAQPSGLPTPDLSQSLPPASHPLTVKVWTERQTYFAGQEVKIFVQGNKDFYGLIVYRDVAGNVVKLLPNGTRRDNLFLGGQLYVIPDHQDQFKLVVQPPFGAESIVVFASTDQLAQVTGAPLGGGLTHLPGTVDSVRKQTRALAVVPLANTVDEGEFIESSWPITTSPR